MWRFRDFYQKLKTIVLHEHVVNSNRVLPICICVKEAELRDAFFTIQSLMDNTVDNEKLVIRVICREQKTIDNMDLSAWMNLHINLSIIYADDWFNQMEDYDKWLFLVPGCIVCQDLGKLFELKFSDEAFAAALVLKNQILNRYIQKDVRLEPDSYIDSSVMLVNEPIMKRYYQEIRSELSCCSNAPDPLEKALNRICIGHIKILDQRWNCSWDPVFADSRNEFLLYEDSMRYQEGMSHPAIINYSGIYKPWAYPIYKESGYFWRVAEKTDFYEKQIEKLSLQTGTSTEKIKSEIQTVISECE